ncbi:hypothetical protein [aff. Roholtiella sp. LEGE 12411]|uniref:hypothetical protein n=1 Tax=aff. Roholtiella sp. LEGE 12411 TaxID=1828822 RepID=UPI0018814C74|nr:hypothetical protein [aff. Roholtiella sp. LEGE 12411]MBE9038219.1 hypothetical protein [aff. Roholtiella sp. LEGE 12411]
MATRTLSLKPLCDGSFTFLTSSIICDLEKVFAKKLGFLPNKESQVFNFVTVNLPQLEAFQDVRQQG